MVTAETAAVLPVLVILVSFGLLGVSAAGAQVRCADAAREAARAAARGDSPDQVRAAAIAAAPSGAAVTVTTGADEVSVSVVAQVGVGGRLLPSLTVSGHAVAALEPDGAG